MRTGLRFVLTGLALLALPLSALSQAHDQCWLQYHGWLNSGANPSAAEIQAKIQELGAQYNIPWEVMCAVAYQESGVRQFASDGRLVHNVTECKANYQKYVLGMSVSAPTPPGLGMMQLTGGTASSIEAQPWTQLRASWQYNLAAGFQVMAGKMSAYLNSTSTPSTIKTEVSQHRDVIENWYMALWRYNGYVGNYGSYANTIFSLMNTRPGVLATLIPASIPATKPAAVFSHFNDSAYGEAYVARPDASWTCKHGYNYSGAVHLTSASAPPPPPPPSTTTFPKIRQVTTTTLNVRTGPGTTYAIVGTTSNGQRWVVIAQDGGWYKIWYHGASAWFYGGYTAASSGTAAKVTVTDLNVRTGPSTGYSIAGQIHLGQLYVVTGSSGDWRRIYWKGGQYWVYGPYTQSVTLN